MSPDESKEDALRELAGSISYPLPQQTRDMLVAAADEIQHLRAIAKQVKPQLGFLQ